MATDWTDPSNPTFPVDDTLNDIVALSALEAELKDPANGVVSDATEVSGLSANDPLDDPATIVTASFTADRSAAQQTAFDTVIANHDGERLESGFQFWENNTVDSTTSEAWEVAFSRTSKPLSAGIHILTCFFELQIVPSGGLNSKAEARFTVNGSVKAIFRMADNDWTGFTGWDRYNADEGERVELGIEIRRNPGVGGNDAVECRRKKLGLEAKNGSE